MIAVGGDVFDEAKDSWTKGDLFEKNHVILMMERILFWRRNKNQMSYLVTSMLTNEQ